MNQKAAIFGPSTTRWVLASPDATDEEAAAGGVELVPDGDNNWLLLKGDAGDMMFDAGDERVRVVSGPPTLDLQPGDRLTFSDGSESWWFGVIEYSGRHRTITDDGETVSWLEITLSNSVTAVHRDGAVRTEAGPMPRPGSNERVLADWQCQNKDILDDDAVVSCDRPHLPDEPTDAMVAELRATVHFSDRPKAKQALQATLNAARQEQTCTTELDTPTADELKPLPMGRRIVAATMFEDHDK